jgi:hypothetical protein
MVPAPRITSGATRLYLAALFLCPPSFRREFSMEMALDLEEAIADAKLAGTKRELLALCATVSRDLAATLIVQWLRTGIPMLLIVWTTGAVGVMHVAGEVLPRQLFAVPTTADREFVALMVVTGGVLFVIFATILFSFWFLNPFLRRQRR